MEHGLALAGSATSTPSGGAVETTVVVVDIAVRERFGAIFDPGQNVRESAGKVQQLQVGEVLARPDAPWSSNPAASDVQHPTPAHAAFPPMCLS